MSFRTVVIGQRSKLDLRMGYLVIHRDSETIRIFLDEINTLILENPACCITGCLIVELIKRKIKVIFCDEKHSQSSGRLRRSASFRVVQFYRGLKLTFSIGQFPERLRVVQFYRGLKLGLIYGADVRCLRVVQFYRGLKQSE